MSEMANLRLELSIATTVARAKDSHFSKLKKIKVPPPPHPPPLTPPHPTGWGASLLKIDPRIAGER